MIRGGTARASYIQRRWRRHWAVHFKEPWRERMFLASVSFLMTFASIRAITHAIRRKKGPFRNVKVGSTHIHHLAFGIGLLHLVGYWMLIEVERQLPRRWANRSAAVIYAAGAAMTLDEFALWLRLEDVYWAKEGRASVDAVVIFGALLSAGVWGGNFFRALGRDLRKLGDEFPRETDTHNMASTSKGRVAHRPMRKGSIPTRRTNIS